jgi:hypothetical protein
MGSGFPLPISLLLTPPPFLPAGDALLALAAQPQVIQR